MTCNCASIGAPKDIRFCDEHHKYFIGDRQLDSVSRVIRTVFPTDYSAVSPEVLENARERGERVDRYFSEYLRSGMVLVKAGERADVLERLTRLIDWFDWSGLKVAAVQEIVYSEIDGVAGMLDVRTDTAVLDVKAVSELQPAYALQLGAYAEYKNADHVGIIHVDAKRVRQVAYDAAKCRAWWRKAVDWFRTMKEIR